MNYAQLIVMPLLLYMAGFFFITMRIYDYYERIKIIVETKDNIARELALQKLKGNFDEEFHKEANEILKRKWIDYNNELRKFRYYQTILKKIYLRSKE